jgi:hypothetical protein
MGGFALDTRDRDEEIPGEYIDSSPRLFLGLEATEAVAKLGFLPDIAQQSIKDKSKADSLAKILVIFQASWLIFQCIARFATQLAVTTLELNTLAHAACALLIYLLWWEKPLDIQCPTILTGDWVPVVAASLWMCSCPRRRFVREAYLKLDFLNNLVLIIVCAWNTRSELTHLKWTSQELASQYLTGYIEIRTGQSGESFIATISRDACVLIAKDRGRKTFSAHDIGEKGEDGSTAIIRMYDNRPYDRELLCVFSGIVVSSTRYQGFIGIPNHSDVRRWQLFRRCTRDYPQFIRSFLRLREPDLSRDTEHTGSGHQSPGLFHTLDTDCGDGHSYSRPFLGQPYHQLRPRHETQLTDIRPPNWVLANKWLRSIFVFSFTAVLYGGIHAKAWQAHFPTEIEGQMWKASVIYVALYGIFMFGAWKLVLLMSFDKYPRRLVAILAGTGSALIVVLTMLYSFYRSYLVVEGFIGLRSLPATAFETPDWPEYLPHL